MTNIFNGVEVYDNTIRIVSDNAEKILAELIQKLYTNNIHIESLEVMPPTLEEIFLSMIER
jgi:hypothetical protein